MELIKVGRAAADSFISAIGDECINFKGFLYANKRVNIWSDESRCGLLTEKNGLVQLYSKSPEFIAAARRKLSDKVYFYSDLERSVADELLNGRETEWQSYCHILKYPHEVSPQYEIPAGVRVDNIGAEWVDLVNDNYTYRDEYSRRKIYSEITSRPSSAVYVDGKPVAWTLLHGDFSMGAMFVLPEYRRRGYAYLASAALIEKVLACNMTPYIQVVYDNYASLGLAERLGFIKIFEAKWFEI